MSQNTTHSPEADVDRQPTAPAREFSVQMPATRKGAHRARTLAAEQLRAWRLPCDAAAHIVAELAANAVLHGHVPGRGFRLTLTAVSAETLRIEVTDARAERLPALPRREDTAAESGRGLLLVAALASRWGVTSGPVPCKNGLGRARPSAHALSAQQPNTQGSDQGMPAYMKRTTIKIDEAVDLRMRNEAARRGMTVSEWTREAIGAHLPGTKPDDVTVRRVFHSAGAGDSGHTDISERMEELLAGLTEWRATLAEEEGAERPERRTA